MRSADYFLDSGLCSLSSCHVYLEQKFAANAAMIPSGKGWNLPAIHSECRPVVGMGKGLVFGSGTIVTHRQEGMCICLPRGLIDLFPPICQGHLSDRGLTDPHLSLAQCRYEVHSAIEMVAVKSLHQQGCREIRYSPQAANHAGHAR